MYADYALKTLWYEGSAISHSSVAATTYCGYNACPRRVLAMLQLYLIETNPRFKVLMYPAIK